MNKTLMLGAALAMLVAAPALAQSYDPNVGTGNIVPAPAAWQNHFTASDHDAYSSYAPSQATLDRLRGIRAQALPTMANDRVYMSGHYVGADPDPNVRLQLRRDAPDILD